GSKSGAVRRHSNGCCQLSELHLQCVAWTSLWLGAAKGIRRRSANGAGAFSGRLCSTSFWCRPRDHSHFRFERDGNGGAEKLKGIRYDSNRNRKIRKAFGEKQELGTSSHSGGPPVRRVCFDWSDRSSTGGTYFTDTSWSSFKDR